MLVASGLTYTVPSLPPLHTSTIPIPLPPDSLPTPSKPPDFPSSVGPRSEGIPFITCTLAHACPTCTPGDTARMHSVPDTYVFPNPFVAELTQNEKPVQYHSTIKAMDVSDYPVLSCLVDVHQKPEGWVDTQVAAMQMVLTRFIRNGAHPYSMPFTKMAIIFFP
ncbi:hypothetical protein EDB84DRAFT_1270963 [Lactarius hengduanensis]|nr:hypothetical protein EDB84DRAFT_1270963 [Lactarius hengduanensis]